MDDLPAVLVDDLLRPREDVPGVGVDRLVGLDAAELGVPVALVAKAGDEDPLDGLGLVLEFFAAVGVVGRR